MEAALLEFPEHQVLLIAITFGDSELFIDNMVCICVLMQTCTLTNKNQSFEVGSL